MANEQKNKNRLGQRFLGTVLGKHSIREALVEMLNCFYSPKITFQYLDIDGTSIITKDADVTMGPLGWQAKIDLANGNNPLAGGGTSTTYQITAIYDADFFTVQTLASDGVTLGGVNILVAKKRDFRTSLTTEVVDGVTINHTFSDDNHRTSDDGSNSQNEVCWPRFVVGAEIQAAICSNGTPVLDIDENVINLIDQTNRVWMKY